MQDNPSSGSPLYIKDSAGTVAIPLETVGTNISTTTRTPTQEELDDCPHIVFTSQREWEPTKNKFLASRWTIEGDKAARISGVEIQQQSRNQLLNKMINVDGFSQRLISSCRVTLVPKVSHAVVTNLPTSNTFVSGHRKLDVLPQSLAD